MLLLLCLFFLVLFCVCGNIGEIILFFLGRDIGAVQSESLCSEGKGLYSLIEPCQYHVALPAVSVFF